MKLYKQKLPVKSDAMDLIGEFASVEDAQTNARDLAIADKCSEHVWSFRIDENGERCPPFEMVVNDSYKLIVRDW